MHLSNTEDMLFQKMFVAVVHDVLRHRIGLSYEAEAGNVNAEEIISKIVNKVEVP